MLSDQSPPVLPPTRYTIPRPIPVVTPAIIELNNGSEMTILYCKKSKASTIPGQHDGTIQGIDHHALA